MILFVFFPMTVSVVFATDYYVKDYGAVGDGTTDDLPALMEVIEDFINDNSPSTLYFESNKVYRCIPTEEHILFRMNNKQNKTIVGNGSEILGDVDLLGFELRNSDNIEVSGLTFDYNTLSWTQGKVTAVDPIEGSFVMEIEAGYPMPVGYTTPPPTNPWGMIWGPTGYEIKDEIVWTDQRILLGGRSVKVIVRENNKTKLDNMEINDRFTMDIVAKIKSFNHIISSKNITFRNCTYYSGRAQVFVGRTNTGKLHLDGVEIRRRPGTTRLLSAYRGGLIWFNNRMGPIIENCYVEGICDDGINMYSYYAYVNEKSGDDQFTLHRTDNMQVGDTLVFVNMNEGKELGRTNIATLNDDVVTTTSDILNVVAGETDAKTTTYVMNLNISNSMYEIRNNTFRDHRRFAILCRTRDGVIENNNGDNTGGGLVIMNEINSFDEGPFPGNIVAKNNSFTNIRRWPLRIHAATWASTPDKLVSDIRLINNTFSSSTEGEHVASIENARNIELISNTFLDFENDGIELINCDNIIFDCENTLNNTTIASVNDLTIGKMDASDVIFDCSLSVEVDEKKNQLFKFWKEGGFLRVSTDIKNYEGHLYDIHGRKLNNTLFNNKNLLDISSINPGVYIVYISSSGYKQTSKIIL